MLQMSSEMQTAFGIRGNRRSADASGPARARGCRRWSGLVLGCGSHLGRGFQGWAGEAAARLPLGSLSESTRSAVSNNLLESARATHETTSRSGPRALPPTLRVTLLVSFWSVPRTSRLPRTVRRPRRLAVFRDFRVSGTSPFWTRRDSSESEANLQYKAFSFYLILKTLYILKSLQNVRNVVGVIQRSPACPSPRVPWSSTFYHFCFACAFFSLNHLQMRFRHHASLLLNTSTCIS